MAFTSRFALQFRASIAGAKTGPDAEPANRRHRSPALGFGWCRLAHVIQSFRSRNSATPPAIAPGLDDHELARIASRTNGSTEPAWARSLTLQFGGHRHP